MFNLFVPEYSGANFGVTMLLVSSSFFCTVTELDLGTLSIGKVGVTLAA